MGIIEIIMKLAEIRNIIIFNLILQSTLTHLSPLRKTSVNAAVTILLFAAYTVAGLSADYAVGLVTRATMTTTTNQPLIALWAPFIFLQVVGPDSIIAFSMEDNKSWFRSSFRTLLTGVVLNRAIIVLLPKTRVAVAVYLVFFAALLKYMERSQALFFGNLNRFKTFTKPIVLERRRQRRLPTSSLTLDDWPGDGWKLSDAEVVRDAFRFFQTFKGVFANVVFSAPEFSWSRNYFAMRDAGDALAVVETELNFAYDVLFTKALVLRQQLGRACRLMTIVFELVAFFIWASVDKRGFDKVDVRITYILVTSALVFDAVSLLMMGLSDWNIARVLERLGEEDPTLPITLIHKFLSLKKKVLPHRWSGSVSLYSLIMLATSKSGPKVEKVMERLKIKDFVYDLRNMSSTSFDDTLRDFIFNEMKYRSLKAEHLQVAKEMSLARGDWILRDYYHNNPLVLTFADTWFTKSMKFEKIVLLWHVATELCYYGYASDTDDHEGKERRELSKVISDYMVYLLVREKTMLSEVAGEAKATLEHTCYEVVKMLVSRKADMKGLKDKEKVERACRIIVMEDPDQLLEGVDEAKDEISVLEGARSLSKELKGMAEQGTDMWEVASKVWAELLCYAASKCKASGHAAQLCKGGQLLTIVWLLMAHLGLSNRFEDPN